VRQYELVGNVDPYSTGHIEEAEQRAPRCQKHPEGRGRRNTFTHRATIYETEEKSFGQPNIKNTLSQTNFEKIYRGRLKNREPGKDE
jgi:hypothetical protein